MIDTINKIKNKLNNVEDEELKELILKLINYNIDLQKDNIIDPLTGLYNRRILGQLQSFPTIAIMCDIDNFKEINDTFGHDMGDYVINSVGKILKKNFRNSDYVCRLGGDEFLILLVESKNENFIMERCNKIVSEIRDSVVLPNYVVTISMGVAINNNFNDLDEMIKKADELLYESKNNGKNQITLDDNEMKL